MARVRCRRARTSRSRPLAAISVLTSDWLFLLPAKSWRLHPLCPVLSNDRLFVLITPTSPKRYDLSRDGRYALQTFPQPKPGSDEFYITGKAVRVEDQAARAGVLRDAKHMANAAEILFELWIDRVILTRWEDVLTSKMRSVHRKWRAPSHPSAV